MSKSRGAARKPKPHEVALTQIQAHYLLGPVVEKVGFHAISRYRQLELPRAAYCQIEGESAIYFDDDLKLDAPHWLGVFALATLVLAVGGPRRLPIPSRLSDLAAQLAALYWWHQLRVGALPEHFELPSELLQWGRHPVLEIAPDCAASRRTRSWRAPGR